MRVIPVVLLCAVAAVLVGCGGSNDTATPNAVESAPMLSSHGSAGLSWESDWDRAVNRAAAEDKLIMANFSADWCIWCKRYDATTFADSAVSQVLEAKVVPLLQEIDGADAERARALRVSAPPTLVFLDAEGKEVGRILGYMPPSRFLSELERILPGEA